MLIQEVGACLFPFHFSSSVISLVLLIFFHSFLVPFHISSFFSFLSFVPFSHLFHFVILFSVFRNLSIFISSSHFSFISPFIYYIRPPSFLSGLGVISLLRCYKPTARTKTRFAKRSSAHHLSPIYRQFIIQWHLLGGA